jgi:hypothetical protein
VRPSEASAYRARKGYYPSFFKDDQGFASVRLNATHALIDLYTSNSPLPAVSEVLLAPLRGAAAAGPGQSVGGGGGGGVLPGLPGVHTGRGGRRLGEGRG